MNKELNNNTPTILIIDDVSVNIKMLQAILKKDGYHTLSATSGEEGRDLALEKRPDLILLDIIMPGEDGFETCLKLKQDPRTMDIPIIFISAMDDVATKVNGLTIGAVDYVSRPFEGLEVLARTRLHLKLSRAYQSIIEEQKAKLMQIQNAQQAFLVRPEDFPDASFGVSYRPVLEAGGDFYDVFQAGNRIFGYFVGDISGHDLGASFTTSALKALIKQNTQPMYTPLETMKVINSVLVGLMDNGDHLTACYGHLNRILMKLTIISAGHPPAIFLSEGKSECLRTSGDILGAFDAVLFEPIYKTVNKGDRFFLYTDGLFERFGDQKRGRRQGINELMAAVEQTGGC